MSDSVTLTAVVRGRVQGVGFRVFVRERAALLGLSGWVRNVPAGNAVEVEASGDREQIDKLLDALHAGPPGSEVSSVEAHYSPAADDAMVSREFEIRR